ncbi:L-rhamnose mutarotase [Algoriphagus namhaensis]|uniref:L-rhamnose mutarotase n=1 Tax=Algoriphagus namhaensis TaxID=915353 RepID=A0ABV8ARX8_9BACT
MKKFHFALDLIDDPESIKKYEEHHAPGNAWPEVVAHDKACGILSIEIFRTGNRMILIMETEDDFDLEEKAKKDAANPMIKKWEDFMWTFQKPLPWAKPGEKWVLMDQIFKSDY